MANSRGGIHKGEKHRWGGKVSVNGLAYGYVVARVDRCVTGKARNSTWLASSSGLALRPKR